MSSLSRTSVADLREIADQARRARSTANRLLAYVKAELAARDGRRAKGGRS